MTVAVAATGSPRRPRQASPSGEPDGRLRSQLLARLAWAYYEQRLYRDARRTFALAASLDASNCRAIAGQAWTALQLRDLSVATERFDAALALISPEQRDWWQEALRGRAWTHCRSGRYNEAVADFTRALDLTDPTYAAVRRDILKGRSRARFLCGHRRQAVADFRASRLPARFPALDAVAMGVSSYAAVVRHRLARRTRP
jgi:tetratricopeptide (TPR) repeat protein